MKWLINWQFYTHTSLPCNQCGNPGCFVFCAVSVLHQLPEQQNNTAVICICTHSNLLYVKTALLICFCKTAGRFLLKFDNYNSPVFLTLLPQARTTVGHPGQKLKLCLAAHHGNSTPPRISPSCPFQNRSTNAGAVIAKQIGHDLLSGRSDPLPTLFAAFMQITCTGGSSRFLQCRCPFSVFYKAHQRMYFSFWIFTLKGSRKGFFRTPKKFLSLLIQFQEHS